MLCNTVDFVWVEQKESSASIVKFVLRNIYNFSVSCNGKGL